MENQDINQAIISEMMVLLERTGVESFAPVLTDSETKVQFAEAFLSNLKSMNAGYDKQEAIAQIRELMDRYNIQIDELMEKIKG